MPKSPQLTDESNSTGSLIVQLDMLVTDGEPEPEREFSFFPKLALGLRRMIWKYALPEGRIIKIGLGKKENNLNEPIK